MRSMVCGWTAPIVGVLVHVALVSGQEVITRVQPTVEVRQTVPTEVEADGPIDVDVRVHNAGRTTAEEVTVSDSLEHGVEFVSAEPKPDISAGTMKWSLGRMEGGEERVIRVRLKRASGVTDPRLLHTIEVTCLGRGRNTAEARVRQPSLSLVIAGADRATVGIPTSLRLTIKNTGTTPARDIVMQSLLPEGLAHPQGRDLENTLEPLEPGKSRTITLTVTPERAGELSAKVRLTAAAMSPVEEVAKLKVTEPALTLSVIEPPKVETDSGVLFELLVSSKASDDRSSVQVEVVLPEELKFVRATDRGTYDSATRTIRWDLGTIKAGEKRGVVWNGIAKSAGKWICPAMLIVDGKLQGEVMCTVRAVPKARDR